MVAADTARTVSDNTSALYMRDGSQDDAGYTDSRPFWRRLLSVLGPGLMVCFADTDGSCLITAADSGSKWNYKLLLLQAALVPTLYCAQELTVRLGLIKGKGLTALIRQEAGKTMGWLVAIPILFDCFLALISEINVIGQTMQACWGTPLPLTNTLCIVLLILLALSGSYTIAERVGLTMGVLQVFFFATMFMAKPDGSEILHDLVEFPLDKPNFVKLVTANIGAVIMPWMLVYQQSALCQKGLDNHHGNDAQLKEHLWMERFDTALGSFLTQGVMAAMLITVAASPEFSGMDIKSPDQLVTIFAHVLGGELRAKWALTFAVCGACIVAAIVVTLAGAWALEEATGEHFEQELLDGLSTTQRVSKNVRSRPLFYCAYITTCIVAWMVSTLTPSFANNLTGVTTQFINGLLMPPVVFALWYLASFKLPEEHRLGRCGKWGQFAVYAVCSLFCLASIPYAVIDCMHGDC